MLTARQIQKKFRNSSENGYTPTLYAINQAAAKLGYKRNNRRGYNDALYTALSTTAELKIQRHGD